MSAADPIPEHGGQLRALATHYGIHPELLLDFSANINPDGPPPGVLSALRKAIADPLSLTLYPDLELTELRASIAAAHGIDPAAVIVANGFVPLLEAVLRSLAPALCLLPVPAFSEYRRTLERAQVRVLTHSLQANNFVVSPASLLTVAQRLGADAILLANPQNPSGVLTPASVIRELLVASAHTLLLDEAFIDYAPEQSLVADAAAHENLIVFRSVTKFFAMPGLRVAYAVARPDRAAAIRSRLPPWPVSTLADVAVRAALGDRTYPQMSRERNARRREQLVAALAGIGVLSEPSAANFLLLLLPRDAESVRARMLREHAIALRTCMNFEGLSGEYLRTAVRGERDNARLVEALAAVLAGRS